MELADGPQTLEGDRVTAIGTLLRMVGDAAAQVGRTAPVVGVLSTDKMDADLDRAVHRLSGDQDWSRGDFWLWPRTTRREVSPSENDTDTGNTLVRDLIGPLRQSGPAVARLKGVRSVKEALARLQPRVRSGAPIADLLDRLRVADVDAHADVFEAWLGTVLERARLEAALHTENQPDDDDHDHGDVS